MHRTIVLAVALALSACGAASSTAAHTTLPMPAEVGARQQLLAAFGRTLFAAMQGGDVHGVLADDTELRSLFTPEAATRYSLLRNATLRGGDIATPEQLRLALGHAQFAGLCLQGSRDVAPGGVEGLRARGWLLDRVLVAGDDVRAGRMAAWVEGTFVLTDRGIVAIAIDRVEAPRQRHSDLELGACDMAVGLDDH